MKEIKQRNIFSESIKVSKQSPCVSLTVHLLIQKFKRQSHWMSLMVSLFWYGCDLWALQVLESGGISGTGSEEVQVAGSGKFGLFILDQERQQQQQAVP